MKAVGVKELKARLSEYLRYVKPGRSVLVADRGEVIAELRPLRGGRLDPRETEPIDALAEACEITRSQRPKAGWRWRPKGLGLPEGTAQSLLDAVRGGPFVDSPPGSRSGIGGTACRCGTGAR